MVTTNYQDHPFRAPFGPTVPIIYPATKTQEIGFFVPYSSALMTFRKTGEQDPEVKLHKHGRQMYGTEAAHPFAYFNQIP